MKDKKSYKSYKKIKKILNENRFVKKTKSSIISLIFSRVGLYALLIGLQIAFFVYLYNYISVDSTVILGSSALISAISLLVVLNMEINPYQKLSWFFLIAIFPTFGILFFILSRVDIGKKMEEKSIIDSEDETNYLHAVDDELIEKIKEYDSDFYRLAKYLND